MTAVNPFSGFDHCKDMLDARRLADLDDYWMSRIAELACIKASGALEEACRTLLSRYVAGKSNRHVVSYCESHIKAFSNPSPEKIKTELAKFGHDWIDRVDVFWDDQIKSSIGSLVANRHQIAHGRNTTVTIGRVRAWMDDARAFCEFLSKEILQL